MKPLSSWLRRFSSIAAAIAALSFYCLAPRAAESPPTKANLTVSDPRPVAMALRRLSKEYGYSLTYEDPLYLYNDDIEDATDKIRLQPYVPGQPRALIPKSGTVNLDYTLSASGEPADLLNVISQLLQVDAQRSGSRFKFFQDREFVHVIPTRTRSKTGEWVSQASILDARISIPAEQRSVNELFEAICKALTQTSGIRVISGTVPLNAFMRGQSDEGADNEVAREVIVRMLERFPQKSSWSIKYAPDMQYYVFNVAFVGNPRIGAQRSQTLPQGIQGGPRPTSPTRNKL